ncbi:hypothetical protein BDV95DRAFT_486737 [Massariosphaeria phaeospora]|uniref:DUF202 domain-containing protein n=1 Tax=Massariosphaeria phaeospora TaxID=100035 RepID=A0A7C8MCB5_9PLEO|nr:hypothetical protein BDV95DRAFT_486737 [Massariosphaeria phaeospora]
MTERDGSIRASPHALPPAALHFNASPPHPDSEESRQNGRHRTAQELESLHGLQRDLGRSPTIRSRGTSRGSSHRPGVHRSISNISTAQDSQGPDAHNAPRYRLRRQAPHWYDPMVNFWATQISVAIDDGAHRDHLALERTFLGYLRTSLALAMTGVLIAQLFHLQHAVNPSPKFGFFVLGTPLAASFIGLGVVVLLIGAFRFWRQQNAMIRGKVHAGGWEITGIMLLSILLCVALFALAVAVDIDKTYF